MSKLFNLVSTKLVVEKEILEAELEDVLNNRNELDLTKRLDMSVQKIKEISTVMTTISLWESYNNNLKTKKEDGNINKN
jgi:hypothetical protein|tara:strand:+ start:5456 stop:5692 length:237 start_codon:yes stop_codon:yes gene_type:complete